MTSCDVYNMTQLLQQGSSEIELPLCCHYRIAIIQAGGMTAFVPIQARSLMEAAGSKGLLQYVPVHDYRIQKLKKRRSYTLKL